MGWALWRGRWDFRAAETHFRRAIELSPGDAQSHAKYSLFLKSMGRFPEAFNEIKAAAFLSPLEGYTQANAGHLLGLMQRYDEAEEYFRRALELMPNHPYIHLRHADVLLMRGSNDAAIAEFEKAASLSNAQLEKLSWLAYAYAVSGHREETVGLLTQFLRAYSEKKQYISPFQIAMVYAGLNDRENTLKWLEEAYTQHDEWMVYLHVYPEFKSLHSDQQFVDLERRVGLVK
jgi:tetratricopeptide (TPR) repeat protein